MALKKELSVDLLGVNALDPWTSKSSSPRKAMFATHIGQAPVVLGNEPRRNFTGVETEYARHSFNIKFPVDATVLKIVRKFQPGVGRDAISRNPLLTVIYEDYYQHLHKEIGILQIPEYQSYHQDFGFSYVKRSDVMERLAPGASISKDDVLAASPAIRPNGQYGMGIEAECAFMSVPGTIEDGFVVSRSFLKRMVPEGIHTRTANFGRKFFPLNLYGDDTIYKPFPDVGQRIRKDGLIFALREFDDELAIAEMTPAALRQVDYAFDRPVYGEAGAEVVDVMVYHDDRLNPASTPTKMDEQARKYFDALNQYYRTLFDEYKRLKGRWKDSLVLTPEFNQAVVEAQYFLGVKEGEGRKLTRVYRLDPLDEWRVEVTYKYRMTPTDGYKFTDFHGGKGVVCKVMDDADMPMDANGNRADVIIYGQSTIKRMNIGRMYEQLINACSRDLTQRLRQEAGLNSKLTPTSHQLAVIGQDQELVERQWETLMRYYAIVSPLQVNLMRDDEDHARHVKAVLRDGIYLYIPPDNPTDDLEMMRQLINGEFSPTYTPVTYRNTAGKMVTTRSKVLIGSLYIMMLEKTGEDWSGVASVKVQHFGVPAKLNNYDKQASPGRQQSVRGLGESETRSYACTVGPEATMELLDQSNNPQAHRYATESILKARLPTNIPKAVDRQKIPLGNSRPVEFTRHFLECRGMAFVYRSDNANAPEQLDLTRYANLRTKENQA